MTPLPASFRRTLGPLFGLLALTASGCGISDYENRMVAQQKRLDRFDREAKELGGALGMPTVPDAVQKQRVDVFLRVPKGIATTPETKLWNGIFAPYPGGGTFTGLYLAWADKNKDFRTRVRGIPAFSGSRVTDSAYTTDPAPGHEPMTLDATTFELADRTYYLYMDAGRRIALVYELAQSKQGKAALDAMYLSVSTLALGADAAKERSAFNKRPKPSHK